MASSNGHGPDGVVPIVSDDQLLAQFEDLLRAIAGEVGQRSVAPHVEQLARLAGAQEDNLAQHAEKIAALVAAHDDKLSAHAEHMAGIGQAHDDLQKRHATSLTKLSEAHGHRLDAHADFLERGLAKFIQKTAGLLAQQTQILERALAQAAHRELQAETIIQDVRRVLHDGLAANRQAFEAVVATLSARLDEQQQAQLKKLDQTWEIVHATEQAVTGHLAVAESMQGIMNRLPEQLDSQLTTHEKTLREQTGAIRATTDLLAERSLAYEQGVRDALEAAERRDDVAVEAVRQTDDTMKGLRSEIVDDLGKALEKLSSADEVRARRTHEQLIGAQKESAEYLGRLERTINSFERRGAELAEQLVEVQKTASQGISNLEGQVAQRTRRLGVTQQATVERLDALEHQVAQLTEQIQALHAVITAPRGLGKLFSREEKA